MKRTFQRKKKKRLRKHGFLSRTKFCPKVILSRRQKGRWSLTPSNSRRASS